MSFNLILVSNVHFISFFSRYYLIPMTRADQPSKLSMFVWLLCLISSTFFQAERGKRRDGLWIKHRWGRSLRVSQRAYTIGESTTTQTIYDGWLFGTLIFVSQVLPDFCSREVPSLLCFCMFCFCLFRSILLLHFFPPALVSASKLFSSGGFFFSFLYIFSECFH